MARLSAGKFWGLRRLADGAGRFKMTAIDQRPPIEDPIRKHYGTAQAPWEDVAHFKELLIEQLQPESSAMLLDPHYAYPRGVSKLDPRLGLILTLEDSAFRDLPGGRLSAEIDDWSVDKIKRIGGDAVKVLAWYRPDADAGVCKAQQDFVRRIGQACTRFDLPFVFELLVYPLAGEGDQTRDYIETKSKRPQLVLDSVREFADPNYGVDVFKLESPVPAAQLPEFGGHGAADAQRWFDALGEAAGRPWVMLSAGAGPGQFRRVLEYAYRAGACGYLAGRAIWLEAFRQFPDWEGIRRELAGPALVFMRELNELTDAEAHPWFAHPCFGADGPGVRPADGSFRRSYPGFGA